MFLDDLSMLELYNSLVQVWVTVFFNILKQICESSKTPVLQARPEVGRFSHILVKKHYRTGPQSAHQPTCFWSLWYMWLYNFLSFATPGNSHGDGKSKDYWNWTYSNNVILPSQQIYNQMPWIMTSYRHSSHPAQTQEGRRRGLHVSEELPPLQLQEANHLLMQWRGKGESECLGHTFFVSLLVLSFFSIVIYN